MSFPQMACGKTRNPQTSTDDCTHEVMADFETSSFSFAASVQRLPTTHLPLLQLLLLIRRYCGPWTQSVIILILLLFFPKRNQTPVLTRDRDDRRNRATRLLSSLFSVSHPLKPTSLGNIPKQVKCTFFSVVNH